MEIKTEADSFSITECSHDAKPSTGVFGYYFFSVFLLLRPLVVHCLITLLCVLSFGCCVKLSILAK